VLNPQQFTELWLWTFARPKGLIEVCMVILADIYFS